MKILLLEDEMMLQTAISEYLISLGHRVQSFSNGKQAKEVLEDETFDLLVLDINVPHIDGFALLEMLIGNEVYMPTIFISALIDIDDISKAYDLGAHDYLKKPFHLKELGLRINRVADQIKEQNRKHILLSENYSYYKENREIYYCNKVQDLTKKQMAILKILCQNIGMIVSFEQLRSFAWDHEPVDNATIRAEISRLRKALKEDFIQNIKGIGYKVERYIKV